MAYDEQIRTFKDTLSDEARRMHEIMCIAAIVIFPTFAIFDLLTLPDSIYWTVTSVRLCITAALAIWLFIQKRYHTNQLYLTYFAFFSISWFCAWVCAIGGKAILYQNNIAYCTVFLSASLFILWHWGNSVIVVVSSILVYALIIFNTSGITVSEVLLSGGSVVLSLMCLHPVIVAFRYTAFKREFQLKEKIEERNELLRIENIATEQRNHELTLAREETHKANEELKNVNLSLEELVKKRTVGLEEANARMKAAMAELDLFLYSSYHDLKSPMARMKGLLSLLHQEGQNTPRSLEYHARLLTELDDMEDLIEKLNLINTFTNYELKKETVSPRQVIDEVLQLHNALVQGAEVEIKISGNEDIYTDRILLHSMLRCLLENALMYRKEEVKHVVRITVHFGSTFELAVWDNGIGISENILPNIFQMYYRGTEKSKGHGLGLFITKKALDKLHGTIHIHSKPGEYTEFKMTFGLVS